MKTSELHTLKSILTEGIRIEGQDVPIKISYIYIPKIQRSYAQGRKEESDVRKDFLDALFDVLESNEDVDIELSFLFGSQQVMAKRTGKGFELLDGQQRTTTLFLLYWYISMKEQNCVPEYLSMFTYDTRDTSAQFLANITSSTSKINIKESTQSPSYVIKGNKWFTDEYYCDPTVCAMLNMLDAIDLQYQQRKCKDIFVRLERLRFYVLMLEKFDMNDELYIKMNSRGLSLIPFENFKASLVKFMKAKERNGRYGNDIVVDGETPYWFDFTTKIDAKWIDLFWKYDNPSDEACDDIIEIDDKNIGIRYFNFINRYLFTKSCIADNLEKSKLNNLSSFFYTDAESDKMRQRLYGWENYEKMFSSKDYFHGIEKVLDVLHSNWASIKAAIENDPYKNVQDFDIHGDITLKQRVIFAAITEFIEKIPQGKKYNTNEINENFKRMLRVVFNIIENTTTEDEVSTARVIKAVSEIVTASGAITDNFYKSLATSTFKSRNHQLQEEIIKAKEMFSDDEKQTYDPSWEDAFIEAESHPFFKGSILFFFTSRAGSSKNFSERYHIVKKLFNSNGITETYRKDHILIRAIISQINYWSNGLEGRYITEKSEKEKYLKILLTSYPTVRKMFCNYFDTQNTGTLNEYLNNVINNATPNESETIEFKLLFKRLVNDSSASALFDWIQGVENSKSKRFCIQNKRAYLINIPGAWYDRMVLDTERHLIIPYLVNNYSMTYEDDNQKKMMDGPVKDTWGWHVRISTDITTNSEKYKLLLHFNEWKFVDFFIFSNNTDYLVKMFDVSPENKSNDYVKVSSIPYQLEKNKDIIENEINRINNTLNEYEQEKEHLFDVLIDKTHLDESPSIV